MHRHFALFALFAALCAGRAASASSVVLNISGTIFGTKYFPPGGPETGPLSGTVTFDLATGHATAANITGLFTFVDPAIPLTPPAPNYDPTAAPTADYSSVQNGFTTVDLVYHTYAGGGDELNFTVSDALLTSPAGDPFTPNSGTIRAYKSTSGNYYVVNGLLTLPSSVAPTPEPSSLILLGTGAIGLLSGARRRCRRA